VSAYNISFLKCSSNFDKNQTSSVYQYTIFKKCTPPVTVCHTQVRILKPCALTSHYFVWQHGAQWLSTLWTLKKLALGNGHRSDASSYLLIWTNKLSGIQCLMALEIKWRHVEAWCVLSATRVLCTVVRGSQNKFIYIRMRVTCFKALYSIYSSVPLTLSLLTKLTTNFSVATQSPILPFFSNSKMSVVPKHWKFLFGPSFNSSSWTTRQLFPYYRIMDVASPNITFFLSWYNSSLTVTSVY
jgi:hypothetical protein